MLGGADSPENLVLLCNECHHDAPDVGDPSYMLDWMARREPKLARIGPLIEEAVEAAGMKDELERLHRDHRPLVTELTDEVVNSWVGLHGSRITPATMASVAVEVLRRASAKSEGGLTG
jgi:hypothetical protein